MALESSVSSARYPRSDGLGRYYTRDAVGEFLVTHLGDDEPRSVLDLGAGVGSLSLAVAKRWRTANILSVDLDESVHGVLHAQPLGEGRGSYRHLQADALSLYLPDLVREQACTIDAAVCNPPFIRPVWRSGFSEILEDAGLSGCMSTTADVDAAMLFLAQNLRTMAPNATLGIILPDTMISNVRFRDFRRELLQRYCVDRIVKLPRGSFLKTDALASIAIIRKRPPIKGCIELSKLSPHGEIVSAIRVANECAIERFDYDFHQHRSQQTDPQRTMLTLADLGADIRRGSIQHAFAKIKKFSVIHTSSLDRSTFGLWKALPNSTELDCNKARTWVTAEPGDLLMARVGRNMEMKTCGVASGAAVLTDCVYRIRIAEVFREAVLQQLTSENGRAWLASHAYGVGARQLSKRDLLNFPVAI